MAINPVTGLDDEQAADAIQGGRNGFMNAGQSQRSSAYNALAGGLMGLGGQSGAQIKSAINPQQVALQNIQQNPDLMGQKFNAPTWRQKAGNILSGLGR